MKEVKQIWVYTETAKKAKIQSVLDDMTMQELVDKAIDEYLEKRSKSK